MASKFVHVSVYVAHPVWLFFTIHVMYSI